MAKTSIAAAWQRALIILTSAVVSAMVVSCLYWGQKICIPIADLQVNQEQLRVAGADQVEMNLQETCDHLREWLPVLSQEKSMPPRKIAG